MPRYYFNVHNDDETLDFEGTELANPTAAHAYAITVARGMAADTVAQGHLGLSDWIDIQDENHASVGKVTFAQAVEIR